MIELEILNYNYWEHFKAAKELSLILPPDSDRRVSLDLEMNRMLIRINELKTIK